MHLLLELTKFKNVQKNVSSQIKKRVLSNAYFNIAKYELTTKNKIKTIWYFIKSIATLSQYEQNKFKVNILINLIANYNFDKELNMIKWEE